MRRNRILALCLCAVLLCSGCGKIQGKDALEQIDVSPKSGSAIYPSIDTQTRVFMSTQDFLNRCINGDFASTFADLILDDTTFIKQDDFKNWFQTQSGITAGYSLEETRLNSQTEMICSCNGVRYQLTPIKSGDKYKFKFDDFITSNWSVIVPSGMKVSVDGVDLSTFEGAMTQLDTYDQYLVPNISNAPHVLTISCSLAPDVEVPIENTVSPFDGRASIVLPESARMTYIQYAFDVYKDLTDCMMQNDWSLFRRYFLAGSDVDKLSDAFAKGTEKANLYEFHCVGDARDLHESDQDVRFITDSIVEVTFGSMWTWVAPNDVKRDKEGNITELKKWNEMKIKTTMQLCYDKSTANWYVGYIDENSLSRVAPGLEEWR